jgi:hypothetical protein
MNNKSIILILFIGVLITFFISIYAFKSAQDFYYNYDEIKKADYERDIVKSSIAKHDTYYLLQGISGLVGIHISLLLLAGLMYWDYNIKK